ncbi:FAD-dependent oxidoreductase [Acetobacter persici]|uniref:NAD(P)/FAD-dependent oxidoreductase n=1 Tax=Acetobacter persici TaxID=1076596 RepID=UPI0020CF9BD9|nr:FAD-dependent oxidoreductase [Acetobacter persici]MCP9319562.1 FAD-dependent oxidoreductase [Acetobacter persici]
MEPSIVIVGASHAGVQFAAALRELGHAGAITLIGKEATLPYQKPPLSKGFMLGCMSRENLLLRSPTFFESEKIDFRPGVEVLAIDRVAKHITLNTGEKQNYDILMLATGARPHAWPQANLPDGTFTLRSLADAERLRHAATTIQGPIVVVGGGYVSLELAATWRKKHDREVTVLNSGSRVLSRSASTELSDLVTACHREQGVKILSNQRATRILSHDTGAVCAVECAGGLNIPAALVVLGTGVLPEQDLAESAGLPCDNGILVDSQCRTEDPVIFAAGDCANFSSRLTGQRQRLECVQNAHDQARVAASVVMGQDSYYTQVPWFWSDQFDMKIQTAGTLISSSQCIVRGDIEMRKCALYHFSSTGSLQAVETVNMPAEHIHARRLLASVIAPTPAQVAEPTFNPKRFLQNALAYE